MTLRPNRCALARVLVTPEIEEAVRISQDMCRIRVRPPKRNRNRVLRDKWVTIRSTRDCDRCRDWMTFGEQMRHVVVATPGGLISEYSCHRCNDGRRGCGWERDLEAELEDAFDDGSDIPF